MSNLAGATSRSHRLGVSRVINRFWTTVAVAICSLGCTPDQQSVVSPEAISSDVLGSAAQDTTLLRVIDGDTIVVSLNGKEEKVRLVGINTPEKGFCGFEEATRALEILLADSDLGLINAGVDDRDRYGRLLRYLEVDGIDLGLELIRAGLADAAYDSRSGFPRHFREDIYISANESSPSQCIDR